MYQRKSVVCQHNWEYASCVDACRCLYVFALIASALIPTQNVGLPRLTRSRCLWSSQRIIVCLVAREVSLYYFWQKSSMMYIHCIYTVDNSDLPAANIMCTFAWSKFTFKKLIRMRLTFKTNNRKLLCRVTMFTGYYSQKHPEPCHI